MMRLITEVTLMLDIFKRMKETYTVSGTLEWGKISKHFKIWC